MKTSSFQLSGPAKEHPHSLPGRIRPIKDAGDSNSYTDSGSDTGAIGYAAAPLLAGQSEGGSLDSCEEEHEEKEIESDTSSQAPQNEGTSTSFGALLKAQASISKQSRSNVADGSTGGYGLFRKQQVSRHLINHEALERRAGKRDIRDFLRASKHAPAELPSRKAVSRKREVVATQRLNHRDPRFEPFCGAVDEKKTEKDYSFLDAYRDSEMSELKSAIRMTKDSEGKEKLKRALLSMESRTKAQKLKEQQREVTRKHRKEEKEKIEQGKRPFYLKKADQKRMALIERFEGMKGKQVDKIIERRQKRKAAKERKGMPDTRRGQMSSHGI